MAIGGLSFVRGDRASVALQEHRSIRQHRVLSETLVFGANLGAGHAVTHRLVDVADFDGHENAGEDEGNDASGSTGTTPLPSAPVQPARTSSNLSGRSALRRKARMERLKALSDDDGEAA